MVRKLQNLGLGSSVIKVIVSYLSGWKQFVQIAKNKSTIHDNFFGVPQESILGLILFNVYVSELPTANILNKKNKKIFFNNTIFYNFLLKKRHLLWKMFFIRNTICKKIFFVFII